MEEESAGTGMARKYLPNQGNVGKEHFGSDQARVASTSLVKVPRGARLGRRDTARSLTSHGV